MYICISYKFCWQLSVFKVIWSWIHQLFTVWHGMKVTKNSSDCWITCRMNFSFSIFKNFFPSGQGPSGLSTWIAPSSDPSVFIMIPQHQQETPTMDQWHWQCINNQLQVHVYVMHKVRIWTILGLSCAKFGSELCAGNPRIVLVLTHALLILYSCTFISACPRTANGVHVFA